MYLQTVANIKTTRECTASAPPSDSSRHSQEEVSIGSVTRLHHDPLKLHCYLTGCMCRPCGIKIRRSGRGKQRWRGSGGRRSWLRCQRCKDTSSTRQRVVPAEPGRARPLHLLHSGEQVHTHPAGKCHGSNMSFL